MGTKKLPRKAKQWAKEAFSALELAWSIFAEQYPSPKPEEKYNLISMAVPIAAMNRGIDTGSNKMTQAAETVLAEFTTDLSNNPDEPIIASQAFLFAYIDAHLSFDLLGDKMANDCMEYLFEHYDVNIDPFPEKLQQPIAGMIH